MSDTPRTDGVWELHKWSIDCGARMQKLAQGLERELEASDSAINNLTKALYAQQDKTEELRILLERVRDKGDVGDAEINAVLPPNTPFDCFAGEVIENKNKVMFVYGYSRWKKRKRVRK